MGKKQKGGRRQILQLESKKPPQISSKQMKSLIHYSDSDDDSKKSNESDPSVLVSGKEVCPLDTQVADFFKEIDALTVNEECIEPKEGALPIENEFEKEDKDVSNQVLKSETKAVEGTHESGSVVMLSANLQVDQSSNPQDYCSWQEIQDESTGYSYYWNVETNEVTWDCPEEYATYVNNMNTTNANLSLSQDTGKTELNLKKSKKKKSSRNKQEGSIIPISYFGESSSSDESYCSDKIVRKSRLKKKKSEKVRNKSKIELQSEISNEIIGPQLPPDFQFPNDEDSNKTSKTLISSNETAEHVEINSSSNQTINNGIDSKTCSESSFDVPNLFRGPNHLDSIGTSSNIPKEETFNKVKNIAHIDRETGKESPDSTVKPGLGLIVEYNSFSDEDEEVSTSNTSVKQFSSNDLSLTPIIPNQEGIQDQDDVKNIKTESIKEIESTKTIFTGVKRKNFDEFESTESFGDKKSKKSMISNSLNIDNLFASHVSNQKHGFGFKMHEDDLELYEATNSSDNYVNRNLNRKNVFKSVNFVKSDQILDLNDLCVSTFLETGQPVTMKTLEPIQSDDEKAYVEELDLELKNMKSTINDEKAYCEELDLELKKSESIISDNKCEASNSTLISHSSENAASLTFEEDIDEIDKALCEALEAKKAMEKDPVSCSDVPSQEDKESNDYAIESSSDDNDSCHSKKVDDPIQETDKTSILSLSSDLVDKLTFLVSNHSTLASLSTLLIQLQTRLIDWQASALESKYFMARLQEVNHYMYQYETSVVSGDWICQWDRENKRYFYTNGKTNHSQWTYPEDLIKDSSSESTQQEVPMSSASSVSSDRDELPTVSSSKPEKPLRSNTSQTLKDIEEDYTAAPSNVPSPPPPPPGVSPPPPPPSSPPPSSPPPPPPDSTDRTRDLPEDMDLENSNDSCSHPIISNTLYEANQIHYSSMISCSSNHLKNYVENLAPSVSSSFKTTNEDSSLMPQSQHTFPIVSNSSSVNSTHVLWSAPQPSCSSDSLKDGLQTQTTVTTSAFAQSSDSVVNSCPSSSNGVQQSSSEDVVNKTNVNTANPPIKKEKKKTKLLSVLALKKKNIPSLVEKWQKIREEQEKEDH